MSEKEVEKEIEGKGAEDEKPDETKSATIADVRNIVDETFEKIKTLIPGSSDKSSDDNDSNDDDKGDKKDGEGRTSNRLSLRDVEAAAERAVRKAVEDAGLIKKDAEDKGEKKEPKAPVEAKPPSKPRRLSSLMLGKNYLNEANK